MNKKQEHTDRELLNMLLEAIDYSFLKANGEYDKSLTYPVIDKVRYIKNKLGLKSFSEFKIFAMDEKVKKFVEEYNKRMDWNKDIRDSLNLDFSPIYTDIIKDCLTTEKLDEEGYELEDASCYTYDDGLMELQAFSNTAYRTHYFWVMPYEKDAENTYKAEKVDIFKKEINKRLEELKQFVAEENELQKIKEKLS